eukprot:jgi/Hompol1/3282/HPOL_006446-RA
MQPEEHRGRFFVNDINHALVFQKRFETDDLPVYAEAINEPAPPLSAEMASFAEGSVVVMTFDESNLVRLFNASPIISTIVESAISVDKFYPFAGALSKQSTFVNTNVHEITIKNKPWSYDPDKQFSASFGTVYHSSTGLDLFSARLNKYFNLDNYQPTKISGSFDPGSQIRVAQLALNIFAAMWNAGYKLVADVDFNSSRSNNLLDLNSTFIFEPTLPSIDPTILVGILFLPEECLYQPNATIYPIGLPKDNPNFHATLTTTLGQISSSLTGWYTSNNAFARFADIVAVMKTFGFKL